MPGILRRLSGLRSAVRNFAGLALLLSASLFAGPAFAAPNVQIAPASENYGNWLVGDSSYTQTFTVDNNAGGTPPTDNVQIDSITITGADPGSFQFALTGTCTIGSILTSDGVSTCTIDVYFKPTTSGNLTASLQVGYSLTAGGGAGSTAASLEGDGYLAQDIALEISDANLDFGNQMVGTTSAPLSTILKNLDPWDLGIPDGEIYIDDIYLTDSTNFSVNGGSSSCSSGGMYLNPQENCFLVVNFNPTTVGEKVALLVVEYDYDGDPYTGLITVTGNAVPVGGPVLSVSDSDLNFNPQLVGTTSAPQTVLLSNTGATTLYYGAIAPVPGAQYNVLTPGGLACNSAGGTLAPGATCGFAVTFAPTSAGNKFAAISIDWGDDNTYDFGTAIIALSGLGVASGPVIHLTPTNLDFGGQLVGTTSTVLSATITNVGDAGSTLNLGGYSTIVTDVGDGTADFAFNAALSTCDNDSTLSQFESCVVAFTFTPNETGNLKAHVALTGGGGAILTLTGYGVANAPIIQVSDLDLDFGPHTVNITSSTLSTTVTNTGNANLILGAPTLTGAEFAVDAAVSTCDDAPATTTGLVPGASCVFALRLTPSATGVRNGSLRINSNDPQRNTAATAPVVNLTGLGTQPPLDNLPVLDFGKVNEGETSGPLSVSIINPGAAPITLTNPYFTIGGANAAEFAVISPAAAGYCSDDLQLNPGESCIITLQFTPAITGTTSLRTALLTGSATNGQTLAVSLTGIGVAVPKLKVFSQTLNFGSEYIGDTGPAQIVQLTNVGSAALTIPAGIRTDGTVDTSMGLNLIGPHYTDFIIDPAQSTCDDGVVLDPPDPINANPPGVNNTCYFLVRFKPTAAGTRVAQVQINSDAVGAPHFVSMTGNGLSPPPEPGAPPDEGVNINVNVNISTGIGINPAKVTYNVAGCYDREMFLVINAPAMGHGWSYVNTANEFVPIPSTLAMITPWKLIGPYDGTHVLFEGQLPPGTYEIYLGCDFVKDGKLNIDVGNHVNGIYDYASVIIK